MHAPRTLSRASVVQLRSLNAGCAGACDPHAADGNRYSETSRWTGPPHNVISWRARMPASASVREGV
jgi:hypothetical protein